MYRNPFWIMFLSVVFIGTAIYSGFAAYSFWQYLRLDKQIQAEQIQWSVLSLSDDHYAPFARYQFLLLGNKFHGETQWQERFLNEWTAKEAVIRLKQSTPFVWYDSSNPKVSTLEKLFPLKESLYAGSLWLLSFYFLGLGYYVSGKLTS